jgi:serine/threonine protein kinase
VVGRTLHNYKIVAELGAGGMGVVYEAVDLRLDRRVALKILPTDKSADEERRARFLLEARTASALNDPHIVTIFDIFTADGTDVLVMELVSGRTLRQLLDDGPMPLTDALDIAGQVAEGVGTAHAAGIVHRDLKPGNVMVSPRGRVKVLDFGLAKQMGDALADQATTMATVAGMLMGTVDYMSPEQARGDIIDARSDIFSLGAMLYEMIAGVRPFTAGHALGVLHEIVSGKVVPVRTRRPEATAEIEQIVSRALERDVTARYQTMEALANDLRRAQRGVLAGSPATVEMPAPTVTPAPIVTPPPLPPPAPTDGRANAAQSSGAHPVAPSSGSFTPVPPPAVVSPIIAGATAVAHGWRDRPRGGKRRSRWKFFGIVIAVLWMFNWGRCSDSDDQRVPSGRNGRGSDVADPSAIGDAVGEGVASGLLKLAPGSAEVQLVSAKLFWENAQRTKDPADINKAEDAFNEAIRLGLEDKSDENEARDALREIAAMKKSSAAPVEETSPSAAPVRNAAPGPE